MTPQLGTWTYCGRYAVLSDHGNGTAPWRYDARALERAVTNMITLGNFSRAEWFRATLVELHKQPFYLDGNPLSLGPRTKTE